MPVAFAVFALAILQAVGAIRVDNSRPPQEQKPFVAPFVAMSTPPALPKVEFDACPGEGCQFGKWTARQAVTVYSTWTAKRKPLAHLNPGEKVTAITGVDIVLSASHGVFDRDVEAIKRFKKNLAIERAAGQRVDDLFDLGGDDVAAGELIVVEDLAEEPFGEQVLDQHLVHGVAADVRVQGRLTEGEEAGEGVLKPLVVGVGKDPLKRRPYRLGPRYRQLRWHRRAGVIGGDILVARLI